MRPMICISRAPIENLLAYRRRMGWSFNWASSYESDFNFDYGISADDRPTHDVSPLMQANEVAAYPLLGDQQVRDSMPPVATQNADATGTNIVGYFSEGHGFSTFARDGDTVYYCYSTYARGTEFLMGYYAILDRAPQGPRRRRRHVASPPRRVRRVTHNMPDTYTGESTAQNNRRSGFATQRAKRKKLTASAGR